MRLAGRFTGAVGRLAALGIEPERAGGTRAPQPESPRKLNIGRIASFLDQPSGDVAVDRALDSDAVWWLRISLWTQRRLTEALATTGADTAHHDALLRAQIPCEIGR
jgi:hypothetical protein